MKLPLGIATQLKQMLDGEEVQSSRLKQPLVAKMLEDGAIHYRGISKLKGKFYIKNKENLFNYLISEFGIHDLNQYIVQMNNSDLTRSEAVEISSNSKVKKIRTFKGFLVNCYKPIEVVINGISTILQPVDGTFIYIYDFERFAIPEGVTIVGVENPENFRYIGKQRRLFNSIVPLFVSRYPQNKDLVKWIKGVPNNYLHFGDFDFEGVNIFLNEFKKHLGDRANFFIPEGIDLMIKSKGNPDNYNTQIYRQPEIKNLNDEKLIELIQIIHRHKKGLEQEYVINANFDHLGDL